MLHNLFNFEKSQIRNILSFWKPSWALKVILKRSRDINSKNFIVAPIENVKKRNYFKNLSEI